MTLGLILPVAAAVALGAAVGFWALPAWADAETLGAARSGPRTRTAAALATAGAFGLLTWRAGLDPLLPASLATAALGTAVSIVDLREKRIPNRMLLLAAPVIAVLLVVGILIEADPTRLLAPISGGAAMFALYFGIALIVPGAMGMGDVKLAAVLGAALGTAGLTAWIVGLFGAFLIGGIAALIALIAGRVGWRGSLPFGPSMVVGAVLGLAL